MLQNHSCLLIFLLFFIISSCAPKTRTIDPLTKSEYSEINNIAIIVSVDQQFSVMLERAKGDAYSEYYWMYSSHDDDCFLCDLIAFVIIESIDSYHDKKSDEKVAEEISGKLEQFDPGKELSNKLKENLQSTGARFNVEIADNNSPSILISQGFDSILEVTLNEWGLELCPKNLRNPEFKEYNELLEEWSMYESKYGGAKKMLYGEESIDISEEEQEKMDRLRSQVARYADDEKLNSQIQASAKIIRLEDNEIIFERVEFFKDTKCEWLGDIKANPEILYDILSNALNNLAISTVKEIQ